jgi:hypothetical protein
MVTDRLPADGGIPTAEGMQRLKDARPRKVTPEFAAWMEVWLEAKEAVVNAYMDGRLIYREPDA